MTPATMEEKIGDQLMRPEQNRMNIVQAKKVNHPGFNALSQGFLGKIYQYVDDK